MKFKDHEIGKDLWLSKEHLFREFYGAFYDFINKTEEGKKDLEGHSINNKEDFYRYADYYADGQENCYAIGFAFHKYFLLPNQDLNLDNQPETVFIGYCHHHDLFTDFIEFLVSYFAYWRNDEGCTCMDPYNYADHFTVSSWAVLVDTSKLFYFTSKTVYFWHSYRIKYILDHIPGVILSTNPMDVAGYETVGYDEEGAIVLKRRDIYNYWQKEEKKIKKVYIKDWKRVDPA